MSEIREVRTLKEWKLNAELHPITDAGFEQTKKNLQFGQHTTLLIRTDGTVIGGNHRLAAMRELEFETAECIVLDFEKDEKGYYAVLDGKTYRDKAGNIPYHFDTIEEGEIALGLSHNSMPSKYKEDTVKSLTTIFPKIEWKMFSGNFKEPVNFGNIKPVAQETKEVAFTTSAMPKLVICPECSHRFNPKEHYEQNN